MNRGQQRLADYLAHIIEAVDRIEQYTSPRRLVLSGAKPNAHASAKGM